MWNKSIEIHKTVLRINIKLMFCCCNLTLAKYIPNSPSYSKSCELFLNLIFLKYNPYCGYFLPKRESFSIPSLVQPWSLWLPAPGYIITDCDKSCSYNWVPGGLRNCSNVSSCLPPIPVHLHSSLNLTV